ncbi:MAG: class II fructose-bisphosphatase [Candidatus Neomarinimicrobiota bacterium]|nr:MAG: class II fructose-bisphosphatase [Candidatus Neomarinimicrobiota bacterium]
MDRNLALEIVRVTEAAALASAEWVGRGDGKGADQAAVSAMRECLDSISFKGTVVIGEGERDEAPMLFIGENVGNGESPEVDIAVDPLECTNSVAYGRSNALAVIAIAPKGKLLHAPDTYMEKIAVGPEAAEAINLNASVEENIGRVAECLGYKIPELTVVILDRERHEHLIERVRKTGARIHLIADGDVSSAIAAAMPDTGVNLLLGIGGAPEGVLAAAALRCIGGAMQGRLVPRNQEERERAIRMGVKDINKVFDLKELAQGEDIMFAATGVTNGDLLKGVIFRKDGASTYSLVLRQSSGTRRLIESDHYFKAGHPVRILDQ